MFLEAFSIKKIELRQGEDFITLGTLLKIAGIIQTGGAAKFFLAENNVLVNGETETRRGRKLYRDFKIDVLNETFLIV